MCVQRQELIVAESLLGSLGPFSNPGLKSIRNYILVTHVLYKGHSIYKYHVFAQEFTCVSGNYPVDELCSEVSLTFWSNFMVSPQQLNRTYTGSGCL